MRTCPDRIWVFVKSKPCGWNSGFFLLDLENYNRCPDTISGYLVKDQPKEDTQLMFWGFGFASVGSHCWH